MATELDFTFVASALLIGSFLTAVPTLPSNGKKGARRWADRFIVAGIWRENAGTVFIT